MRILLVSPNKEMFPPAFPLGLCYLSSFLENNGHSVEIIDLICEDDEIGALDKAVKSFSPELIGFSIRNIDNTLCNVPKLYYPGYKELIDHIKSITDVPVILGGAGFSILPAELLKYYGVTYGIIGEGEIALYEFAERYSRHEDVSSIPGLIINKDDRIVISKQKYDFDFNFSEIPFPKRNTRYLDDYRPDGRRWLNIQSKRGCSQKCIYCTYPHLEGTCMRVRTPESVGLELEYLCNELDAGMITFVDGVFNSPYQHAIDICNEIINRKINVEWTAPLVPSLALMPPELIDKLYEAGCRTADFSGTDTASELMLKNMHKSFTKKDILEVSKLCQDKGLRVVHSLLLGGPGETQDTIKESLELMEKVAPNTLWVSMGIRIYPNTELQRIAISEGVIKPDEDLLTPKFYISPSLRNMDWKELIRGYSITHPDWALTCVADNYFEWVSEIIKYADALNGVD